MTTEAKKRQDQALREVLEELERIAQELAEENDEEAFKELNFDDD